MIEYRIGSDNPAGHYFDVVLIINQPDPQGQILRLPAWIPGSYMIRDFARNIIEIQASTAQEQVELTQLDKSSWQLPQVDGPVTIRYKVYAWDLSVRGAHLDTTHGFFNGTSVFLEVIGQLDVPCNVQIDLPYHDDCESWRVATTLPRVGGEDYKPGTFRAENYQELIDHPVEMGDFRLLTFAAGGIRHDVVLTGRFSCDEKQLTNDLQKICSYQKSMFGSAPEMGRYLFLVMIVGEGYGGLEHRSSTSLLCSRDDLPQPGQQKQSEAYRGFLGLCSHEYFHSWNVKRIRPAILAQADLTSEVYTPLLWAFEGITSYYDDLALLRSGCIDLPAYLEMLGQTITRVARGAGRFRQSAAESSFNAWTRFYKQDENAANAIVSYYAKGSLIALCIDLKMRQLTDGKYSLDDVMRELWQRYLQTGEGVEEFEIQQIIIDLAGTEISPLLQQWIYQTEELPLQELLQALSIDLDFRAAAGLQDKGGKAEAVVWPVSLGVMLKEVDASLQVVTVTENSAAMQAGIAAGDTLIAINGLKASMKRFLSWITQSQPGDQADLVCFRRDELMNFKVSLQAATEDTAVLTPADESNIRLQAWQTGQSSR